MDTIPIPQTAVNNNRAEGSNIPAIGILALATISQERKESAPSTAPMTYTARGTERRVVATAWTCKVRNVLGIQSGLLCLSDAALVGKLDGGDETRPVVVFSVNISVPDPPFLDVRHHRFFPVDPVGKNDCSLELFTRHGI